jgi:hypothetical protein
MIACVSLPPLGDGQLGGALEDLLNAQAHANAYWFKANPDAPSLAESGVKYREPRLATMQRFPNAPETLRSGFTGCAGAATYVVGQALPLGIQARVRVQPLRPAGEYHAVVEWPDGRTTDPSATLPR